MPANPQVTDEMCIAAAQSDGEFDGRGWMAMPRAERERYLERSRKALTAALADHVVGWRDIESAPKDGTLILAYNVAHDEQVVVGWTADPHMPIWPNGCWTDSGNRNRQINYTVNENFFQLWMPLPAAPTPNREDAGT